MLGAPEESTVETGAGVEYNAVLSVASTPALNRSRRDRLRGELTGGGVTGASPEPCDGEDGGEGVPGACCPVPFARALGYK